MSCPVTSCICLDVCDLIGELVLSDVIHLNGRRWADVLLFFCLVFLHRRGQRNLYRKQRKIGTDRTAAAHLLSFGQTRPDYTANSTRSSSPSPSCRPPAPTLHSRSGRPVNPSKSRCHRNYHLGSPQRPGTTTSRSTCSPTSPVAASFIRPLC